MTDFGKLAGNLNVGGAQSSSSIQPLLGTSGVGLVLDVGEFFVLENDADNAVPASGGSVCISGSLGDTILVAGVLGYQNIGSNEQFAKIVVQLQVAQTLLTDPTPDSSRFHTFWTTTVVASGVQSGDAEFDLFAPIPVDFCFAATPTRKVWVRFLITTPEGVTGEQKLGGAEDTVVQAGISLYTLINLGHNHAAPE